MMIFELKLPIPFQLTYVLDSDSFVNCILLTKLTTDHRLSRTYVEAGKGHVRSYFILVVTADRTTVPVKQLMQIRGRQPAHLGSLQ